MIMVKVCIQMWAYNIVYVGVVVHIRAVPDSAKRIPRFRAQTALT